MKIANEIFNLEVQVKNNEVSFDAESVAKCLGLSRVAKSGNESVRWERVNAYLEAYPQVGTLKKGSYIPEAAVYLLAMKANNELAVKFQLWLATEVLPDIRENGCHVAPNITDEQQEDLQAFSAPRYRKETFLTTPVEKLQETYQKCLNYHKRKPAIDKIKIQKEIIKTLEKRKDAALTNGSAPLALLIAEEIKTIQKHITTTANKSNGRKLSIKNKEIIELQQTLHQLEPSQDEYHTINFHAFTVNYCTQAYYHSIVSTPSYKKWKNNFPINEFPEELNIDFDKPVLIWMYFDHQNKYDVANLHKTFIDKLCSHYGVDDKNINIMRCCTNSYVDDYRDGKIYFAIRQGEWQ